MAVKGLEFYSNIFEKGNKINDVLEFFHCRTKPHFEIEFYGVDGKEDGTIVIIYPETDELGYPYSKNITQSELIEILVKTEQKESIKIIDDVIIHKNKEEAKIYINIIINVLEKYIRQFKVIFKGKDIFKPLEKSLKEIKRLLKRNYAPLIEGEKTSRYTNLSGDITERIVWKGEEKLLLSLFKELLTLDVPNSKEKLLQVSDEKLISLIHNHFAILVDGKPKVLEGPYIKSVIWGNKPPKRFVFKLEILGTK